MKKYLVFSVFLFLFLGFEVNAQKIEWRSPEEAETLIKENPDKPLFFDVYTSWCSWCKVMDSKTFSQPKVAKYINENFIPVKWDAQTKETVSYFGEYYYFNDNYNTLSYKLLNNRLAFPTLVIADEKGDVVEMSEGYLTEDELLTWLKSIQRSN